MKTIASILATLLPFAFIAFVITSWGMNIYRLTQCDFKESYKAEIVHGIGMFTPIFIVTGWLDLGE